MGNRSILPSRRQEILKTALERIDQGHKLQDIAESNGISYRTLQYWLMHIGDDYVKVRQAHTDAIVNDAMQDIAEITIPNRADFDDVRELEAATKVQQLRLARAAQVFKSVSWYAQLRDPRYKPQAIQVAGQTSPLTINLSTLTDEQLRAVAAITVQRDDNVVDAEVVPRGGVSQEEEGGE